MDLVLKGIQFKYVMVYIDDICILPNSFEDHLVHLQEIFTLLWQAKLKIHPKKCKFAVKEMHYLGHVLSPQGIRGFTVDDLLSDNVHLNLPPKILSAHPMIEDEFARPLIWPLQFISVLDI